MKEEYSITNSGKGTSILLLGLLAILFGDIFPGSSPGWFLDPVGIFVTFPLYLLQVLITYNWAIRNQKLNFKSLYLFGMLIGLTEETWVTKVLYSGATSATTALVINIGGFALVEFFILIFFWHPLMTINLTLFTFQALSIKKDKTINNLDENSSLPLSKQGRYLYFIISIMSAFVMSLFGSNNFILEIITIGFTIFLICIIEFIRVKKTEDDLSLSNLVLSTKAFQFAIFLLICLYILLFFFFRPFALPSWPTLVITGILYVPILLLIRRTPKKNYDKKYSNSNFQFIIGFLFLTFILTIIFFLFLNSFLELIVRSIYVIAIISGLIIFLKVIKNNSLDEL